MSTTPLLLDKDEAAASLKISVRQLNRLMAAGQVRSVRVGKRLVRFTPTALQEYVTSLETASSPAPTWPRRTLKTRRPLR